MTALVSTADRATSKDIKIPLGNPKKAAGTEAVAYFAEGCFWHAEIVFKAWLV